MQGLRALARFSGINDAKFSNVYLSIGVAPLLVLAGLHFVSSASWLIGGLFYPVMPLLAMSVYLGTFKGLKEIAKTDGEAGCLWREPRAALLTRRQHSLAWPTGLLPGVFGQRILLLA